MMIIQTKHLNINVYGDGEKGFDGFYLICMDEFDENDEPTGEKKGCYVKKGNGFRSHVDFKHSISEISEMLWNGKSNAKYEISRETKIVDIR